MPLRVLPGRSDDVHALIFPPFLISFWIYIQGMGIKSWSSLGRDISQSFRWRWGHLTGLVTTPIPLSEPEFLGKIISWHDSLFILHLGWSPYGPWARVVGFVTRTRLDYLEVTPFRLCIGRQVRRHRTPGSYCMLVLRGDDSVHGRKNTWLNAERTVVFIDLDADLSERLMIWHCPGLATFDVTFCDNTAHPMANDVPPSLATSYIQTSSVTHPSPLAIPQP